MILNEVLTKQNVITKLALQDGDKEIPKALKVKIMRIRMAYNKIKQRFDSDAQEFTKEIVTEELQILSNKTDIQALSHEEFAGGRIHSINLKNNLDNNVFSEVVKEVERKYTIDESAIAEKINLSEMKATGYSVDDGNTTYSINCSFKIGSRIISKVKIEGNCAFALMDSSNNNNKM
jgi:hypothetical protein